MNRYELPSLCLDYVRLEDLKLGYSIRERVGKGIFTIQDEDTLQTIKGLIQQRDFEAKYPDHAAKYWNVKPKQPYIQYDGTREGLAQATAEAQRARYVEEFKNYGMLLDTMTPQELAVEIGGNFMPPKQAALLAHMAARIIALEMRLNGRE